MTDVSPFFAAVTAGDTHLVRELLAGDPALAAALSVEGATAALTALYRGHTALADELAARAGGLSVFEAAAFDDTERLAALVQADPAAVAAWSGDGWQPLHLAAYFGRSEAARLLLDADAPVDEPSRNAMAVLPLHAAASGRHSELVWILIASDAPVDARQSSGSTALHSAAFNGDLESIQALLAAGADPELADRDGRRPVDLAADDSVRALLEPPA